MNEDGNYDEKKEERKKENESMLGRVLGVRRKKFSSVCCVLSSGIKIRLLSYIISRATVHMWIDNKEEK